MKPKLLILIGLAMLCLPAYSAPVKPQLLTPLYYPVLTNVVWIKPHMFYHNPVTGWGEIDAAPSPLDDQIRYFFDGENDGTFSPNDTLISITYSGTNRFYQISQGGTPNSPYEVNHPVTRNPDGSFPSYYLGVLYYGGPYIYP